VACATPNRNMCASFTTLAPLGVCGLFCPPALCAPLSRCGFASGFGGAGARLGGHLPRFDGTGRPHVPPSGSALVALSRRRRVHPYSSQPQRAFSSKSSLHKLSPVAIFPVLPRATKGLAIQFLGVRQRFSYVCSYCQEERLSDILYASQWWPTSR
jgi:hypothetical protein